ncbi:flavin reductase family protein [Janibacter sp. GS2]|uniref:flavin reductase family protein n=1 Tax=Janibacter sp. GS2 TaxID=3442646 RepID=UPI003EBA378D
MTTAPSFDTKAFRDVLGHYPTGVVIVTAVHPDGEPLAMIVGTFTAVSMEPPLVAFMPMKSSRTFGRLSECESLCINVLTGEQEEIGRCIASRGPDKLLGIDWSPSPSGAPLLAESLAWLDVRIEQTIEAGDHWIVLCRIEDMAVNNPKTPLIFFQGGYGRFVVPPLLARIDNDIVGPVQQASRSRDLLATVAERLRCEVSLLTVVDKDELVAIATAVGEGVNPAKGLGTRVPIIPPIGDIWAAELTEEQQQSWLSKADVDDETMDIYRDRLAFAQDHGYLMSFLPAGRVDPYREIHEAAHRYADGGITPLAQREIQRSIGNAGVSYEVAELDPAKTYDVGMLVATVHDPSGAPARMLRLAQLPHPASGRVVLEWVDALRETVSALEQVLFEDSD